MDIDMIEHHNESFDHFYVPPCGHSTYSIAMLLI